jgi:hypothetical protein
MPRKMVLELERADVEILLHMLEQIYVFEGETVYENEPEKESRRRYLVNILQKKLGIRV